MELVFAIVVLLASIALFNRAAGSLSLLQVNMSTYAFYVLFGTAFLGSTAVIYGLGDQRPLATLSDDSVLHTAWLAVMYAMLAVPGGMLLANLLFGRGDVRAKLADYRTRPMEVGAPGDAELRISLMVASLIAALALGYTLYSIEQVPLFSVLRGFLDPWELSTQRATARLGDDQLNLRGILDQFIGFGQIVTFAAFAYWARARRSSDKWWFWLTLAPTVLSLTYMITKGPFIMFMAAMILLFVATRGSVRSGTVGIMGMVASVVVVAMYVFYRDATADGRSLVDVWVDVVTGRIAFGNLLSFYYILDIFPRLQPHLGFSSTGRLIHEFAGLPFSPDYGIIAMSYWDPIRVADGTAGHMTSVFLSEAWANFGWPGLIVAPWLVGWVIQCCHLWFAGSRKTPLHVGLYVYITINFTLTSGFVPFYYPAWLFQLATVALVFFGLAKLMFAMRPGTFSTKAGSRVSEYRPGVIGSRFTTR